MAGTSRVSASSFKVEWALDLRRLIPFGNGNPPPPNELIWFDPGRVDDDGNVGTMPEIDELIARKREYVGTTVETELKRIQRKLTEPISPLGRFQVGEAKGFGVDTPLWYSNDRINGGSPGQADRYYPVALRITVDLYDQARRLERPIRHVFILPIGSG